MEFSKSPEKISTESYNASVQILNVIYKRLGEMGYEPDAVEFFDVLLNSLCACQIHLFERHCKADKKMEFIELVGQTIAINLDAKKA